MLLVEYQQDAHLKIIADFPQIVAKCDTKRSKQESLITKII